MPELVRTHTARVASGRRLEPHGDAVLRGAGQDPDAFKSYFGYIGIHKPALDMPYVGLTEDIACYFDALRRELNAFLPAVLMPQISLISWNWGGHSPVWHGWGAARVWANATILNRYQYELADPLFRHAVI